MNCRIPSYCLCAFLLVLGCREQPDQQPTSSSEFFQTSTENYPNLHGPQARKFSGVIGIIKVSAEHTLRGTFDDEVVEAHYIAQGAGVVVMNDNKGLVVTARHLVVPNRNLRAFSPPGSDDSSEPIRFENVSSLGARVAIGPLAIEPATVILANDKDICIFEIAPEDLAAIQHDTHIDPGAPMPVDIPNGLTEAGRDVEAWGFPGDHLPQVEKASVSADQGGYFVLNKALANGFSGGFVVVDAGKRRFPIGLMIRANSKVHQTTVLAWPEVASIIKRVFEGNFSTVGQKIPPSGKIILDGVPFELQHLFPEP